jgi:hypothetical protein
MATYYKDKITLKIQGQDKNTLFLFWFLFAGHNNHKGTATRPQEFTGQEINNQFMQRQELIRRPHMYKHLNRA